MIISKVDICDLSIILEIQKLAFYSEAEMVGDLTIEPMTQTLEGIMGDYKSGVILKAEESPDSIIGSVRGRYSDGTLHINRLVVHPSHQNRGVGTALLLHIESLYPNARYELYTNASSPRNVHFYIKNGYAEYKRAPLNDNFDFVYMEKYGKT